jgi:hypothetical protein
MFGSAFTIACSLGDAFPAANNFSYCRLAVSCISLSSFTNNFNGSERVTVNLPSVIRRFVAACNSSCITVTLLMPEASPKLPPLINIIRSPFLA